MKREANATVRYPVVEFCAKAATNQEQKESHLIRFSIHLNFFSSLEEDVVVEKL